MVETSEVESGEMELINFGSPSVMRWWDDGIVAFSNSICYNND